MAHWIGVRARVCMCVCVRALLTARERDRDCRIFICCKYSSAVLPAEVSSIHCSSVTQIEVCFVSVFRSSTAAVFGYLVVTNKIFQCRLHLERIFPPFLSVLSVSCLHLLYCGFSSVSYRQSAAVLQSSSLCAVLYLLLNADNVHVCHKTANVTDTCDLQFV
jgi:hypothetical protein